MVETKIPQQLQNTNFRFIKIQQRKKNPFEKKWQNENNYTWNNPEFQQHINNGGNYGVVCGYGNLVVIDADKPKIIETIENNLPETFVVETGRGGKHYYYICHDIDKPIRMKEEKMGDLGDIQYTGKQVVGPGSIHPNGKEYKIIKDKTISEILIEQIRYSLKDFIKSDESNFEEEKELTKKMNIKNNIPITNVISISGLKKRGDEYQGAHPIHGSDTGQNFCVNTQKNVWHCFRHDTGGGPLTWLAVEEGIISCSDATHGALQGEKFKKVIKKAEEKGLIKKQTKNVEKYLTEKGVIIPEKIADDIIKEYRFITTNDNEELYYYNEGIYHEHAETIVNTEVEKRLGDLSKKYYANETIFIIKAKTYTNRKEINKHKHLLHLQNGIFDLNETKLIPFTPDIISTVKLPITYNPDADCPNIKKFLTETLNSYDIPIIQELFGYCLIKAYPIQKAFMFLGDGANGKSTLLSIFKNFLGEENTSGVALQELISNRFAKGDVYGKLANMYADLPDQALYHTGEFKMLTGGDMFSAEKKFKERFRFINYAKLIFSANKLPETRDFTTAFFRRWVIINFPNIFEGENADKGLLKKLITEEELSGLFNWALEGLHRLLLNGSFSNSISTEETQDMYERMSSPVLGFIKDYVDVDPDGWISKDDFYSSFIQYCKQNNLPRKAKNVIGREIPQYLENIKTERRKSGGIRVMGWSGIKLREKDSLDDYVKDSVRVEGKGNLDKYGRDGRDGRAFPSLRVNKKDIILYNNIRIGENYGILDIPDTKDNKIGLWMIKHYKNHKSITKEFFEKDTLKMFPEADPRKIRGAYDILKEQEQEEKAESFEEEE